MKRQGSKLTTPTARQPSISKFFQPKSSSESASTDNDITACKPLKVPVSPVKEQSCRAAVKRTASDAVTNTDSLDASESENTSPKRRRMAILEPLCRSPELKANKTRAGSEIVNLTPVVKRIEALSATEPPTPPTNVESTSARSNRPPSHILKAISGMDFSRKRNVDADSPQQEESDENENETSSPVVANKKSGKKSTFTPLELQYMEIRKRNADTLLMIEVGYKFRFFGEDAQVAAKILGIMCYKSHSFMTASIPVQRVNIHLKRLVNAGHKVGVVRQTEIAAAKTGAKPFSRDVTGVYTLGTLIDDVGAADNVVESNSPNHLMLVYEDVKSKPGKCFLSFVAVQLATGSVIYDSFEDNAMRCQLDTRMTHISPAEILLPVELSPESEKYFDFFAGLQRSKGKFFRIERRDNFRGYSDALQAVLDFSSKSNSQEIIKLPSGVIVCFADLIKYLEVFKMQRALLQLDNFRSFSDSGSSLLMDAVALRNLEIFENTSDGTSRGSLFWILDHTCTPMGKRLLAQWLRSPLVKPSEIEARLAMVDEISQLVDSHSTLPQLRALMKKLPDVEKGICKIFYGKISALDLVKLFRSFVPLLPIIKEMGSQKFASAELAGLVDRLQPCIHLIGHFLAFFNEQSVDTGDKFNIFRDESQFPSIIDAKKNLSGIEDRLQQHLLVVQKTLGDPKLSYSKVSGVEYLIEVKLSQKKKVPVDWSVISQTKACARYHTPVIVKEVREVEKARDKIIHSVNESFFATLEEIRMEYASFRAVVQALATLDCLMSLAFVSQMPNFCRPEILTDGEQKVVVVQGRHPMIDSFLEMNFVPNDINLSSAENAVMLITGPNMGGKSSYIRQVAIISIMAQIGSYCPATSVRLTPFDAIYTRMGSSNDLGRGVSTFMLELQEASTIMSHATMKSLVILDELGRGTSTHDGVAIAYSALHYFITQIKCLTLFVTHYPSLSVFSERYSNVRCFHMGHLIDENNEDIVTFLYKLTEGMASRSYGINVARLANVPSSIMERAKIMSRKMENSIQSRHFDTARKAKTIYVSQLLKACRSGDAKLLRVILNEIPFLTKN